MTHKHHFPQALADGDPSLWEVEGHPEKGGTLLLVRVLAAKGVPKRASPWRSQLCRRDSCVFGTPKRFRRMHNKN